MKLIGGEEIADDDPRALAMRPRKRRVMWIRAHMALGACIVCGCHPMPGRRALTLDDQRDAYDLCAPCVRKIVAVATRKRVKS